MDCDRQPVARGAGSDALFRGSPDLAAVCGSVGPGALGKGAPEKVTATFFRQSVLKAGRRRRKKVAVTFSGRLIPPQPLGGISFGRGAVDVAGKGSLGTLAFLFVHFLKCLFDPAAGDVFGKKHIGLG